MGSILLLLLLLYYSFPRQRQFSCLCLLLALGFTVFFPVQRVRGQQYRRLAFTRGDLTRAMLCGMEMSAAELEFSTFNIHLITFKQFYTVESAKASCKSNFDLFCKEICLIKLYGKWMQHKYYKKILFRSVKRYRFKIRFKRYNLKIIFKTWQHL